MYDIGDKNYLQCYCPQHSWKCIQTIWLHSENVAGEDEENHLTAGWFEIPDGTGWGLPEGKYFAKNSDFLCLRKLINFN